MDATYSTSTDDFAIDSCFLDAQENIPKPSQNV
jgi:hypothetical protein